MFTLIHETQAEINQELGCLIWISICSRFVLIFVLDPGLKFIQLEHEFYIVVNLLPEHALLFVRKSGVLRRV